MEDQNYHLTKPITETELYDTIKKTNNEKCPGSDGFTNEFYKEFQTLLAPLLCKTLTGPWRADNTQILGLSH